MSDKAQLDHLLLDVDFFNKPTIIDFQYEHGSSAVLWLIQVYCQMSRATNGCIKKSVLRKLGDDLKITSLEEVIDYASKNNLICNFNDGRHIHEDLYTNARVQQDQASLARKKASKAEANTKYKLRDNLKSSPSELQVVLKDDLPDTDTDTEYINNNINKNSKSEISFQPEIPPENLSETELKLWMLATNAFSQADGTEPWAQTNSFILLGRRPLKNYPNVWIGFKELYELLKVYNDAEFSSAEVKWCFTKAETEAKNQIRSGKPPDRINCVSWLQGHIFTEAQSIHLNYLRTDKVKKRA